MSNNNNNIMNRFINDEQGGLAIVAGISLVTLMVASGVSVDYARNYMVKSQLTSALDAAGLAAGATLNSQDIQQTVDRYFWANFPEGFMGATVDGPHYVLSNNDSVVTVSATATLNSSLMQVAGIDETTLPASVDVTRESQGMELVMVLDVTGSMNSSGKLQSMKNAASGMVKTLYGDDDTKENLWIGLVPYSQTVNIGSKHSSWLNQSAYKKLEYGPDPWAGCVDARSYPKDTKDDVPASGSLPPYHWADDSNNNWIKDNGKYYGGLGKGKGPNKYCPQEVTPMVSDKQRILDDIDSLTAQGNTHSHFGLVWGWRMLSPKWRGLWGSPMPAELPLEYDEPLMNKVVILLTDGENTHSNSSDSAYGYLWQGGLGTTRSSKAEKELDDRLEETCQEMKKAGVIMYTITFRLNSSSTQELFRGCASDPAYYYNSPSNEELSGIFASIADSLGNLRISK